MAQTLPNIIINFAEQGLEGINLYNQGLYWEAHEAWEFIWHTKKGRERAFYQAMIHVAAAMLKVNRLQFPGAHSQLTKALERFSVSGPLTTGTNDEEFRSKTVACRDELLKLGPENMEEFNRSLYPEIKFAPAKSLG